MLFEYIEIYYHRICRHSAIAGYRRSNMKISIIKKIML